MLPRILKPIAIIGCVFASSAAFAASAPRAGPPTWSSACFERVQEGVHHEVRQGSASLSG